MASPEFRFQSSKVHLTYKTHLCIEETKAKMAAYAAVKMMSIVHEQGDVDEDKPTPYDHTHVFVWWVEKVESRNARLFDMEDEDGERLHPNVQTRRGMDWAKGIVMRYHLGHKTKRDGKKYFIEPVCLYQEGVEEWKMQEDMWDIAADAPTLRAACLDLGMVPKSIMDVEKIRKEGRKRTFAVLEDDASKDFISCGVDWDRKKKSLIIAGPPCIGKTQWAIHQFEKPYMVTDVDDLKQIPDGCDGLIFDDMEWTGQKMMQQKHVFDVRKEATIRCRNTNGRKPMLPAIHTTNRLEGLYDKEKDGGALKVRVVEWHVNEKMYV